MAETKFSSGNPYVNPLNPDLRSKPNMNLFYFQDLTNPRLTWKLYSQSGSKLIGPILTGFYSNNSKFGIEQNYSGGMGDDILTALNARLRNGLRELARKSRDIYNYRNQINSAKNAISKAITGGAGFIGNAALDTLGFNGLSDLAKSAGIDPATIMNQVNGVIQDFDIGAELDKQMTRSAVVTQGGMSKLFDTTRVSIPEISNLDCIIWTTPESDCTREIKGLIDSYFLGTFNLISNGGGGYWTSPNNINLAQDNPLSQDLVDGAFTLRAGPYIFRNLILKGFTWEYSKEFVAFPKSDGSKPTPTTKPAYAKCSVNLDNYKYMTDKYLSSTFIPVDKESTDLSSSQGSSLYNENQ